MADEKAKDDKAPKGEKTPKGDKADKGDKAAKADAAPKAPKAAKDGGKGGKEAPKGRPTVATTYETSSGKPSGPKEKPRFAVHYAEKVIPQLMQKFGYKSVMQAPRFVKIVINMGVGDATTDVKNVDIAANELAQISGQKPSVRKAKKA